jgi:hypothetical protein
MASGTKGRLKALELERINKRIVARQKAQALASNRENIIKSICNAQGWSKLEPFAENMLNTALNGGLVDVKQLVNDLAEWQKAQTVETEAETVTEEVKEQCQN